MLLRRLLLFRPPVGRFLSSSSSSPFNFDSHRQEAPGNDTYTHPETPIYNSNHGSGATGTNQWGHQSPGGAEPGNDRQYGTPYPASGGGNYPNFSNSGGIGDSGYQGYASSTNSSYSGWNPQFSNSGGISESGFQGSASNPASASGEGFSNYSPVATGYGFQGSASSANSAFPASSTGWNNSQFSNSGATANSGGNYSQFSNSGAMADSGSQNPASTPNNATSHFQLPNSIPTNPAAGVPSPPFVSQRSYGFSSAEEAAAERRRRKRRLRIEPPLYALRPNPPSPSNSNNPDKPRLPDSTSALVGPRLNLHNRVQSLIRAGDLDAASYIARQSVFQYIRPTVFTCNAIIAAMYRAKRYSDAKALFQYFFRQSDIIPNIVSYNNLIVSHCESSEIEEALKAYEHILENAPYSPSSVTYRHLTKGLIDAGRMDDAVSLLREMLNKGHGADSLVFNNVILGYLNMGKLDKANELFDELKERCTVYDGVVNATFMDWFFNQGKPREAMESYRDLMSKNYRMVPATRNVLLETLLKHGKKKEAWELFHDMLDDHTPPTFQAVNSDTVSMMVNECLKEGNLEEAMDVFKRSGKGIKSKPFQMDVAGFNNMIAKMSELEMMDKAEDYYKQLCDKSLSPDVNTYRALIEAYIKLDKADRMLEKYTKMVEAGLRVIPPYANKWFGYLIEKGMSCDCVPILAKMVEREPKPDVTTYDVIIRGLVGEGNFDGAANVVKEMTSHGIGTTAALREFVLNAFELPDRRAEMDNVFNQFQIMQSNQRPFSSSRGIRPPEQGGGGGRSPAMPWQTPSYGNQQTYQPPERFVHPHGVTEQVAEAEAPLRHIAGQQGF